MFSGFLVDNLLPNRNAPFGTYDYDTDEKASTSCGALWQSGWWHDPLCRPSGDLNVPYEPSQNASQLSNGIHWRDHFGSMRIRTVKMKIRPKSFNSQSVVNSQPATDRTLRLHFRSLNDTDKEPDRVQPPTDPTLRLHFRSLNDTDKEPDRVQPPTNPTLRLHFRSLNNSNKKPDRESAVWRRYRL
jgi:hypothetical protein